MNKDVAAGCRIFDFAGDWQPNENEQVYETRSVAVAVEVGVAADYGLAAAVFGDKFADAVVGDELAAEEQPRVVVAKIGHRLCTKDANFD